jgi:amino acid transporter
MWPLSGVLSIFVTLTMAELASAYPVSGAMASWAWKLARGGIGGERGWGWLMGGVVLGGHVANVSVENRLTTDFLGRGCVGVLMVQILLVTWEMVNIIAGTMGLAYDYEQQTWQMVLFFLAALLLVGLVATQAWGRSHRFWLAAGAYGLSVWLVLCISLLATGATK